MNDTLTQLDTILNERRSVSPETSYVASLHAKGLNKILEKIGEEATEVVIAAKDAQSSGDNTELIYEVADLWFHSLVALSHLNESSEVVLKELARRFNLSGLEEKAQRNK